jgi:hypothetical protein
MPPEPHRGHVDFGRVTEPDTPVFLGFMRVLHAEPAASAFVRLLRKELREDDYVHLAHLFEEVSVLALHRLVSEALLYDAFALDMYWDELREDVLQVRASTGNEKFCENFEIAADRAREYRRLQPSKLRWSRRDRPEGPPPPPPPPGRSGGGGPEPQRPRPAGGTGGAAEPTSTRETGG